MIHGYKAAREMHSRVMEREGGKERGREEPIAQVGSKSCRVRKGAGEKKREAKKEKKAELVAGHAAARSRLFALDRRG